MNTYSPLEASIKLNISKRAVQKRCKKDNIRKIDNKYSITDLILERWAKEIKSSVPVREPSNSGTQDLIKEQEVLLKKYEVELVELDLARAEIKKLKEELSANAPSVADIQELNLDEIEAFEFKFKRAADFYRLGKFVFVPNDKIILQYNIGEYERIRNEYDQLINEIKTGRIKEESFLMLKTSLEEQLAFVKGQMEYYMKLASKTMDSQHLLIEAVSNQNKTNFVAETRRAKNTDWTNKQKGK
jgi:hypothetical protein